MSLGWKYGDRFIQYGDRSRSPFSLHCIELIMRRLSFLLHIDILCDSTWYSPAWCYEMTVTVTGTKPKPKILYNNKMRRLHSGALNAENGGGSTLSAEHPTSCWVNDQSYWLRGMSSVFFGFGTLNTLHPLLVIPRGCVSEPIKAIGVSRPTTAGH